jgi:hypothetical protein
MPKLMVVFDPKDLISGLSTEDRKRFGVKEATLSIQENLEGNDIYQIAKKLAELLLEQL